jgi:hypothetical protein
MKKIYIFNNYKLLWNHYIKLLNRLKNKIRNGSFGKLSFEKRAALLKKFTELRNKLSGLNPSIKPIAASALLTLTLNAVNAQSFTEETGINNPVNSIAAGSYAEPVFADLDKDGDMDLVIGTYYDGIKYFKNTGTVSSPIFTEQSDNDNPFREVQGSGNYGGYLAPFFADLDNDGDLDLILGEDMNSSTNKLRYLKNTGSSSIPVFTEQTGNDNPFDTITSTLDNLDEFDPVLVDIDNDGDLDLFVSEEDRPSIYYFKNTGTASVPVFTQQTESDNPFSTLPGEIYYRPRLAFADLDKDGDFDLVVGYEEYDSNNYSYEWKLGYFKNTGTPNAPAFSWQTGSGNPLGEFTDMSNPAPAFADLDNDGDMDLFTGQEDGTIKYYKNTSAITGTKSIQDISSSLSVYPNPASDHATLSLKNRQEGNCEITLKNLQGMEINKESISKSAFEYNYTLNISNLSPGIYVVEVKNESKVGVVKFVKNK